ncbi:MULTISPECIES: hypothetical protein [unclassified Cupriavidus]|uniref:hypothetical protein n=1 Tax=unclassified Cupriavidus TaxID=2640874 RepID=UPI00313BCBE9
MTALLAILAKAWPALLGGLVALGGLLVGWARHKQAQTTEAQAGQKVAEAGAKVAQIERTEAEADATAARAEVNAVKERTNVENEIAVGAAGESADRLRSDWSRD